MNKKMKTTIDLNSNESTKWTLQYGPQDDNAPKTPRELGKCDWDIIDAEVPGNVELDLLKAGKIKEPMIGNNVYALREYETYQWWYRRNFKGPKVSKDHRVELCFDGVDCIADIWLNNKNIGRFENMFVEHNLDITDLLEDKNELYVCIYSPILEGRKYPREALGVNDDALAESVNIRKAARYVRMGYFTKTR